MTTYRIKEYAEAFIKRDALRKGPKARRLRLPWMSVPTDLQKRAIQRIAMHPRAAEIYGAFILMASVTARATERVDMGILADDEGHPYTPADLEEITGFPADSFAVAIELLASPRVGWLLPVDHDSAGKIPEVAGNIASSAGRKPEVAGKLPARSGFLPADGTGRDGTRRDGTAAAAVDRGEETDAADPSTEPVILSDRERVRPLTPYVQWQTKDPDRTADNLATLIALLDDHGPQVVLTAARDGSMRGSERLWPDQVADYLPKGARATPAPMRSPEHDRILPAAQAIATRLGVAEVVKRLGFTPGSVTSDRQLAIVLGANVGACEELIASETP